LIRTRECGYHVERSRWSRFRVPRVCSRWEELLDEPLDAVLIATSGDHAPIAIEAARAGKHVFVEKPMALSRTSRRAR